MRRRERSPVTACPVRTSQTICQHVVPSRPSRPPLVHRSGPEPGRRPASPGWADALVPSARRLDQALLASSDTRVRLDAARRLVPCDVPLGGWAALAWLGVTALDGRTGPGAATLLPITVCTGPVGRLRTRPGLAVDRSTLMAVDLVEHDGALVTTAERSCLDVMRFLGAEEGLVAADATVRAGTRRPGSALPRRWPGWSGLKGVPQARIAVPLVDGRAESGPESRLRYVWVVEAGLPVPLVNPIVVDRDGRFVARADLLDPEAAPSASTTAAHHRDLQQHTADNVREEDLEGLNLEVTRRRRWTSGRTGAARGPACGPRTGVAPSATAARTPGASDRHEPAEPARAPHRRR